MFITLSTVPLMKRLIPALIVLAAAPVSLALVQDAQQASQNTAAVEQDGAFVAEAKALPETIELTGIFEPAELVEVEIDLESFNQPLKITELAGHGQQVQAGEVLIGVDPEPVGRALAAAENKKEVADVNLSKVKTDMQVASQSDALALRAAQRKLARAEEALSWFDQVDGVALVEQADMLVQRSEDQVEDQTEELDQLRKMYESEELTEDTADIVVKRAIRQLEYAKRMLELNRKRAEKMKQKDYADQKQDLVDALDAQRLANEQLENEQAQRRVQREAALLAAQEAARQASEEYEKLKSDAEKLSVSAPSDGYVFYGQLKDGNWSGADGEALKVGDELKPDQVVMTFFSPGAMQITVDLPEKDRFRVSEGATAKVTPAALPDVKLEAAVKAVSPLAVQKGQNRVFEVALQVPEVDERVAPGFSAKVEMESPGKSLPMVPAKYVKDGTIRVRKDGEVATVSVKTGKAEGEMVQITEGLEAGATVLPPEQPAAAEAAPAADQAPAADAPAAEGAGN